VRRIQYDTKHGPRASNSLLLISDKSSGQGILSLRSSGNITTRRTPKAGSRSTRSPSGPLQVMST
jgi:hypothetical protein